MEEGFETGNIAQLLFKRAAMHPDRLALHIPRGLKGEERYTYQELSDRVLRLMAGLRSEGIRKGDRVLVLFPVCTDLYALIAAIYAVGGVVLLVDPGMGARRITQALGTAKPKAMVSVQALLRFRFILPVLWKVTIKFSLDSTGWGVRPFADLLRHGASSVDSLVRRQDGEQALITFTSGSTGRPKGADRHHQFLMEQHKALCRSFPPYEEQIDMTCFPVVAFHNLSCGSSTIMPDADIAKPATMKPEIIYQQLKKGAVNRLSAAPAFMSRLVTFMKENRLSLPHLKQLAVGGAPVTMGLQRDIAEVLPDCKAFVVYGSTEAEPIAHHPIAPPFEDVPAFVGGTPVSFIDLKIVVLPPNYGTRIDLSLYEVKDVGEIIVSGDHVNKAYIDNSEANKENKIHDREGRIWHRTGDRGYLDDKGCIWLVGRNKDVLVYGEQRIDPYVLEAPILQLDGVRQAALIMHHETLYLFLSFSFWTQDLRDQIRECLRPYGLEKMEILLCRSLPVDGRHNSKIDRPLLRSWLTQWYIFSRSPFRRTML